MFSVTANITDEFTITRGNGSQCNVLPNMPNVYTSIDVLDWESDGRYGTLPVSPDSVTLNTEQEYLEATGCVLPSKFTQY